MESRKRDAPEVTNEDADHSLCEWWQRVGRKRIHDARVAQHRDRRVMGMVTRQKQRGHASLTLEEAGAIWDAMIQSCCNGSCCCYHCQRPVQFVLYDTSHSHDSASPDRLDSHQDYATNHATGQLVLSCTACNILFMKATLEERGQMRQRLATTTTTTTTTVESTITTTALAANTAMRLQELYNEIQTVRGGWMHNGSSNENRLYVGMHEKESHRNSFLAWAHTHSKCEIMNVIGSWHTSPPNHTTTATTTTPTNLLPYPLVVTRRDSNRPWMLENLMAVTSILGRVISTFPDTNTLREYAFRLVKHHPPLTDHVSCTPLLNVMSSTQIPDQVRAWTQTHMAWLKCKLAIVDLTSQLEKLRDHVTNWIQQCASGTTGILHRHTNTGDFTWNRSFQRVMVSRRQMEQLADDSHVLDPAIFDALFPVRTTTRQVVYLETSCVSSSDITDGMDTDGMEHPEITRIRLSTAEEVATYVSKKYAAYPKRWNKSLAICDEANLPSDVHTWRMLYQQRLEAKRQCLALHEQIIAGQEDVIRWLCMHGQWRMMTDWGEIWMMTTSTTTTLLSPAPRSIRALCKDLAQQHLSQQLDHVEWWQKTLEKTHMFYEQDRLSYQTRTHTYTHQEP